ncbi:MAG: HpaII family restriction endonuclease [Mariprofundaceae bacterium]|nr:HpaII family restriction endonuclease [Mariprofundaceae bacterium]
MSDFNFIDLFAGIGGFHIAMESLGGQCVFASEIDPFARKTYEHNFKASNANLFNGGMFNDDIRKINPIDLPDFDVLCAGFPCQPFSQAGHKRGFDDTHKSERGNLFFNIVDILEAKKPKAFFLENVRGIINHDNGKTFKVIREIIENELGYSFHYKVVKAIDYGLPQLRPRIFMIGFKNESILSNFSFPPKIPLKFNMSDVWNGECSREVGFTLRVGGRGSNINDRRNWDSYLVDGEVKKIMPEQARKMQGFPESFEFPVANTQAMKQLGNSVAIDAVKACAKVMIAHLKTLKPDISLSINNNQISKEDEGFGIKSYLGSKPTLLNASGNTNFIFEILHLSPHAIDLVNSINTRTKLKDRIEKIHSLGGDFKFSKIETESMEYNLSMVDSLIPKIISTMLLEFYLNRTNAISDNLENVFNNINTFDTDLITLKVKVKRLLIAILLGFFAGKKWDGGYVSNGVIVVKETGEQVGFHIIDKKSLENYLFENIKFDTPSTSRHRFGNLILENDGKIYFKLNMQLRF